MKPEREMQGKNYSGRIAAAGQLYVPMQLLL
jgi:hypothetical protein